MIICDYGSLKPSTLGKLCHSVLVDKEERPSRDESLSSKTLKKRTKLFLCAQTRCVLKKKKKKRYGFDLYAALQHFSNDAKYNYSLITTLIKRSYI